jgi:hypothetical protein
MSISRNHLKEQLEILDLKVIITENQKSLWDSLADLTRQKK